MRRTGSGSGRSSGLAVATRGPSRWSPCVPVGVPSRGRRVRRVGPARYGARWPGRPVGLAGSGAADGFRRSCRRRPAAHGRRHRGAGVQTRRRHGAGRRAWPGSSAAHVGRPSAATAARARGDAGRVCPRRRCRCDRSHRRVRLPAITARPRRVDTRSHARARGTTRPARRAPRHRAARCPRLRRSAWSSPCPTFGTCTPSAPRTTPVTR
jgi:hypothetical protein